LNLSLLNSLDNTDGNSLAHITDGETSKRREVGEGLDAHGLLGDHLNDGGVSRLDELGGGFEGLTRAAVDLLDELGELAGNMGGVAVEDGGVSGGDLSGVVEDDDLGVEGGGLRGGGVLGVGGNKSTAKFLDRDVLDVESDVVTRVGLLELLVVHLNRLDLSGQVVGGEGDDHTGLDNSGLHTSDGHSSDTSDLVDILERETKGLVGGAGGGLDGVEGVDEGDSGGISRLAGDFPSLVPGHVGGGLEHVISVPSRDGDEGNSIGVVSDLLDEAGNFLLDFVEALLRVLVGVHLVDGNDELLDSEGVGEESVLTGLSVLGNTGLELSGTGGDDEDTAVGLGGSGNHVLDEITMSGGVNDGDVVLGGFELPEGNVDGDTTLALGLKFVQDPSVLEGSLSHIGGILLELLDGTLVDTSELVDQVSSGGGLSGVDVSDDDDVNVVLFLSHSMQKREKGLDSNREVHKRRRKRGGRSKSKEDGKIREQEVEEEKERRKKRWKGYLDVKFFRLKELVT